MPRRRQPAYKPVGRGSALWPPGAKATPSIATSPPPGSYDPAIDAQVGQTNRGLGDLLADYVRDYGEPGTALGGRAGEDYGLGVAGVERDYSRGLGDIMRTRGRAGEDYQQQVAGLNRSFAQLGAAQTQAGRAAGVQRGGFLAQALAKRQENQALARQPIDTGFARFNEDSTLSEGRLGENRDVALGGLRTGLLRGTEDANTALWRAQREAKEFGLDATTQKFFQANMPINPVPETPERPATPRRPPRPRNTLGTNRGPGRR